MCDLFHGEISYVHGTVVVHLNLFLHDTQNQSQRTPATNDELFSNDDGYETRSSTTQTHGPIVLSYQLTTGGRLVSLAQRPGPHGLVSLETTPSQLLGMIVTSDNRCMEANERPGPKALDGILCEQVRRQLQLMFIRSALSDPVMGFLKE